MRDVLTIAEAPAPAAAPAAAETSAPTGESSSSSKKKKKGKKKPTAEAAAAAPAADETPTELPSATDIQKLLKAKTAKKKSTSNEPMALKIAREEALKAKNKKKNRDKAGFNEFSY
jgi:hypothetical protein